MYQWARPEIAVPTHGERRHLLEHCALAKDMQVPIALAPRNGDMVRLAPGHPEVIDEVPSGRLFIDAGMVTPENGEALRERRHAAHNGMLNVSLVLDGKGRLAAGPQIRTLGLPGDEDLPLSEAIEELEDEARAALENMDRSSRGDDEAVRTLVSRKVKKACQRIWDRRPIVETVVLRV
jgi:ribonuclease J